MQGESRGDHIPATVHEIELPEVGLRDHVSLHLAVAVAPCFVDVNT